MSRDMKSQVPGFFLTEFGIPQRLCRVYSSLDRVDGLKFYKEDDVDLLTYCVLQNKR